jgi:hypothetical protein
MMDNMSLGRKGKELKPDAAPVIRAIPGKHAMFLL